MITTDNTLYTDTDQTLTTTGWHDYWTYTYPFCIPAPSFCSGNIHVWACDHAKACRCGQVTRKVGCPHCGQGG